MTKHYTIPIFTPELACPFQCVFCNQQKISGQLSIPTVDEIISTIDSHLHTFKSVNRVVEVGFFGGSFTGIPITQQRAYLKIVRPYIKAGSINSIRLSTRPDYINDEILTMLKKYNVTTIELGAQSFNDDVLKRTRRGHTATQIDTASQLIKSYGFKLGLQMMIGLPGDTLERANYTAQKIIDAGADCTRIYPAVVIKDTLMHRWFSEKRYAPLSLKQAVNLTKQLLPKFENAGVKVIRVGLHPSEGLVTGKELVAGPFHTSFKELVLSAIWHDILYPILEMNDNKKITIHVPPKELSYAIGYGSENRNMLLQKFSSAKFIPDTNITHRNFVVVS